MVFEEAGRFLVLFDLIDVVVADVEVVDVDVEVVDVADVDVFGV